MTSSKPSKVMSGALEVNQASGKLKHESTVGTIRVQKVRRST